MCAAYYCYEASLCLPSVQCQRISQGVTRPATETLRLRRLDLFGKLLRAPEGHLLRTACFSPGTLLPANDRDVLSKGSYQRQCHLFWSTGAGAGNGDQHAGLE